MSDPITLSGTVLHVFAHRFTLTTENGTILADLGPKGSDLAKIVIGDTLTITGEQKPSEIKVQRVRRKGLDIDIPHGGKGDHDHAAVDPNVARESAVKAGLTPLGDPLRRPKHVEILARDADGRHHELHVERDGTVRKRKPVSADDAKWAEAIKAA